MKATALAGLLLAGCTPPAIVDDATNTPQRGMWQVTTATTGAPADRLRIGIMPPLTAALCSEPHVSDPEWITPTLSRQLSRPCKVERTLNEHDGVTGVGFCTPYAPFALTGSATRGRVHLAARFDEGDDFTVTIDAVRTGDCRG